MRGPRFLSYAQNGEDVVLQRAFADVAIGRYLDIGANDPTTHSITRSFYDRGWSGIAIEPSPQFANAFRGARPRDAVVQAAVTNATTPTVVLHEFPGAGLSTLDDDVQAGHAQQGRHATDIEVPAVRLDDVLDQSGWQGQDIHFMVVDVEGSEHAVLASVDLHRWRPFAIVVEATEPLTTRPSFEKWESILLGADYRFTLFDGLSRFYVAAEHADRIGPQLSIPANVTDGYTSVTDELVRADAVAAALAVDTLRGERDGLAAELAAIRLETAATVAAAREDEDAAVAAAMHWRSRAVSGPVPVGTDAQPGEVEFLTATIATNQAHLDAVRATLSWRITAPLRRARPRWLRGTPR